MLPALAPPQSLFCSSVMIMRGLDPVVWPLYCTVLLRSCLNVGLKYFHPCSVEVVVVVTDYCVGFFSSKVSQSFCCYLTD